MAFNAAMTASEAFYEALNLARGVKQTAQNSVAQFAGTTGRDQVLALAMNLREWRIRLAAVAAVPGVGQYAKDQYANQSYDVAAEFNGMLSAIDAVIANITGSFPQAASGEVLERVLNADGSVVMRTFTAAQLSTLRTLLQNLSAAITL